MSDFILLLVVGLHLIRLVLDLGLDVCRIVTSVVHHLFPHGQIHYVRAHRVHEILRMRGDDENMVVRRQVRLEPHHCAQIQVIRRLVEQEQVGLDEEGTGEGDTHTPSSGHVFRRLLHHLLGEPETVKKGAGLRFEGSRVHVLKLLVRRLEGQVVDVVSHGELLDTSLELRDLGFRGSNDEVDSVDVRGLCFARDEVDIDMVWDLDVAVGDRLEEGRLVMGIPD